MGLPIGAKPQKIEDTKIVVSALELGINVDTDDLETIEQACKDYLEKNLPHAKYNSFMPYSNGKVEIKIDVTLGDANGET